MQPSRCLSSHLTEGLLSFRNPLGKDEKWLERPQLVDNYVLFAGRVITTQLALPLLTLSALVESGVCTVFAAGFFLASYCVEVPLHFTAKKWLDRASSARFTVVWNLCNFFLFNLFCKNVFTHESLARYSLDQDHYWTRGRAFRLGVVTSCFALYVFAAACVPHPISVHLIAARVVSELSFPRNLRAQRECDEAYVTEFLRQHPQLTRTLTGNNPTINLSREEFEVILAIRNRHEQEAALRALCETHWRQATGQDLPPVNISRCLDHLLNTYGRRVNIVPLNSAQMAQGVQCFKHDILNAPDIDDTQGVDNNGEERGTKNRIKATDPETIPFVLMRIAYIYVWGEKKNSPLPVFFKPDTRQKISELRQNYKDLEVAFGNKFKSMQAFNGDPEDEAQGKIFKELRRAIGAEINGGAGSFLNACWFKAVTP